MERDLDQLAEQAEAYAGPFKVQAAGPWTLAAALDLPIGGRLLRDPGAVRDLTGSLAEGLRAHVADGGPAAAPGVGAAAARRAVAAGRAGRPGADRERAGRLPGGGVGGRRRRCCATVVDAVGVPTVVHCCAPDVPLELIRAAGAVGVALDLGLVTDLDPLGEAIDAGLGLFAGAVPTRPPSAGGAADLGAGRRPGTPALGPPRLPRRRLAEQVVVTPACGLAGATPEYARAVLAACRDAGRRLAEV